MNKNLGKVFKRIYIVFGIVTTVAFALNLFQKYDVGKGRFESYQEAKRIYQEYQKKCNDNGLCSDPPLFNKLFYYRCNTHSSACSEFPYLMERTSPKVFFILLMFFSYVLSLFVLYFLFRWIFSPLIEEDKKKGSQEEVNNKEKDS